MFYSSHILPFLLLFIYFSCVIILIDVELSETGQKPRVSSPLKLMKLISYSNSSFDFSEQQDPLESLCLLTKKINEEIKENSIKCLKMKFLHQIFYPIPLIHSLEENLPHKSSQDLNPAHITFKNQKFFKFECEKRKWPLEGSFASWLFCQKCSHKSITIQPFTEWTLDLKHLSLSNKSRAVRLEDCLSHFSLPELIPNVFCSSCSHQVAARELANTLKTRRLLSIQAGNKGKSREISGNRLETERDNDRDRMHNYNGMEQGVRNTEFQNGEKSCKERNDEENDIEKEESENLESVLYAIEHCKSLDDCDCKKLAASVSIQWKKVQTHSLKAMMVAKPPEILCLHLHRLALNPFGRIEKDWTRVLFPLHLNISTSLFSHSKLVSNFGVSAISGQVTPSNSKNFLRQKSLHQRNIPFPNLSYDPLKIDQAIVQEIQEKTQEGNAANFNAPLNEKENANEFNSVVLIQGRERNIEENNICESSCEYRPNSGVLGESKSNACDSNAFTMTEDISSNPTTHNEKVLLNKSGDNENPRMDGEGGGILDISMNEIGKASKSLNASSDGKKMFENGFGRSHDGSLNRYSKNDQYNNYDYELVAVVVHLGDEKQGHYIVYRKLRLVNDKEMRMGDTINLKHSNPEATANNADGGRVKDSDNETSYGSRNDIVRNEDASEILERGFRETFEDIWFYISDSRVKQVSVDEVLNSNPTLLFYNRKHV